MIKQKWNTLKVFWKTQINSQLKRRRKQRTWSESKWILITGKEAALTKILDVVRNILKFKKAIARLKASKNHGRCQWQTICFKQIFSLKSAWWKYLMFLNTWLSSILKNVCLVVVLYFSCNVMSFSFKFFDRRDWCVTH